MIREGAGVTVETDRPGVERLLRHALGDRIAVVAGEPDRGGEWRLRVLAGAEEAAADPGAASGSGAGLDRLADYWRGDFAARRRPGRDGGFEVWHQAPFEGVTRCDAEAKILTYLYPVNGAVFLPHLEHLVGHLFRLQGWARGFVDVHAAFVRYRGKGVALIGPRRAGKTSLAMHLLARGGDLLGSDMAQVRVGTGGAIEAVAIPQLCRITRETVDDNARLAAAAREAWDRNHDYLAGPLFSHGKYEVYDPSLDAIFGRPTAIAGMRLDALLFPQFDAGRARHEASAVGWEDAGARLVASIRNDRPLADWLPFDLTDRQRAEAALAETMLAGETALAAFEFRFGREGSLGWDEIDALFEAL